MKVPIISLSAPTCFCGRVGSEEEFSRSIYSIHRSIHTDISTRLSQLIQQQTTVEITDYSQRSSPSFCLQIPLFPNDYIVQMLPEII